MDTSFIVSAAPTVETWFAVVGAIKWPAVRASNEYWEEKNSLLR